MKKSVFFGLILSIILCGCAKDNAEKNNPRKEIMVKSGEIEYINKGNSFAMRLLEETAKRQSGDFVISPLSAQFCLAMLVNGANGETRQEILNAIGFKGDDLPAVNDYYYKLLKELPTLDKKATLNFANGIYLNKDMLFYDSYKETVSNSYEASVESLDFTDGDNLLKTINSWASEHTGGTIPVLIDKIPDIPFFYASFILNAMVFDATWEKKFDSKKTQDATFTNEDSSKRQVRMMYNDDEYIVRKGNTYHSLELPYGNGAFSFFVLLPSGKNTTSDIIEEIREKEGNIFYDETPKKIHVGIPRFSISHLEPFEESFQALGIVQAFDPEKANFRGMCEQSTYIKMARQKTLFEVHETGSKAVTATHVDTGMSTGMPPSFIADHPFVFLIREASTGAILVEGRYGSVPDATEE
ncbi:MAG: serpin family protein [Bacteroidales bacterium]|nr:serpin family protein [Bacteroidales bacterium]